MKYNIYYILSSLNTFWLSSEDSRKHTIAKVIKTRRDFRFSRRRVWGSGFWVVAPCSLVEVCGHFRGACCLRHQGDHRCNNSEDSRLLIKSPQHTSHGRCTGCRPDSDLLMRIYTLEKINRHFAPRQKKCHVVILMTVEGWGGVPWWCNLEW
jgi:hypothetical protein